MHRLTRRMRQSVVLASILAFFQAFPPALLADDLIKLKKFTGTIDMSAEGVHPFTLQGKMPEVGKFTSYGEVAFTKGQCPGTLVGHGVSVFRAANGDLLVGEVAWEVSAKQGDYRTTSMRFSWRDSVTFSDGTVVTNTGRFIHDRPRGLVVIAIIAILIGLLVPAVQKVK